ASLSRNALKTAQSQEVLDQPLQRPLSDSGLIKFHRFGVGLEKPQSAALLDAHVDRHLPEAFALASLDLAGDSQGGPLNLSGDVPVAVSKDGLQDELRIFDGTAHRHVGGDGFRAGHADADSRYTPVAVSPLLQKYPQVEGASLKGGQGDALLPYIRTGSNDPPEQLPQAFRIACRDLLFAFEGLEHHFVSRLVSRDADHPVAGQSIVGLEIDGGKLLQAV